MASTVASVLNENGVHRIAPTLPGWGETSPPIQSQSFHECLFHDVTAIVDHFHPGWRLPGSPKLRLYLVGLAYGSVAAQILYGASYEQFPLGRHIAGLLLVSPTSPPHIHDDFSRCLTWDDYFTLGPISHIFPFNFHHRLTGYFIRERVKTPNHAAQLVQESQRNRLSDEQRNAVKQYWQSHGATLEEAQQRVGDMMSRSVQTSIEGYNMMPKVINSDWGGYDPRIADRDRNIPVLVVVTDTDKEHRLMGEWLVKTLEKATGRFVDTKSAFPYEDILRQFWDMCHQPKKES